MTTVRDGIVSRLLLRRGRPILVRAWQPPKGRFGVRAEAVDPDAVSLPPPALEQLRPAGAGQLAEAGVARMRFALGVDDDLGEFYRRFRRDPLLGPLIRRRPRLRPRRRPWPWEALAWAVVEQLIESGRAAQIQRRIVGRWGARLGPRGAQLRDVPSAELVAGRAPAELEAAGLSPKRAVALARSPARSPPGVSRPVSPQADRRLLAVPEIGPWTVQCLGLFGRGEPDSLPAGDLIYLKLVGRLARLGRRATSKRSRSSTRPMRPSGGSRGFGPSPLDGLSGGCSLLTLRSSAFGLLPVFYPSPKQTPPPTPKDRRNPSIREGCAAPAAETKLA